MTTIFWSQRPMAGRGNGHWPDWQPSTGARYADPMMDHEGRISHLEARADGFDKDLEAFQETQEESQSLLMDLREAFTRHTSRSLVQIARQRWDELTAFLIIGLGISYANQDWLWKIYLLWSGTHPDL